MYKTPDEALSFLQAFLPQISTETPVEVALFPSVTSVPAVVAGVEGFPVKVGLQNMHWLDSGAYTGETSPMMLQATGATHVLIGHSERRQYFNETDSTVNLKVKAAIAHGIVPIICVGEDSAERDGGKTDEVLSRQIAMALLDAVPETTGELIFAYEPVWAIGTGKTATPQIAEDAHKLIREMIARSLSASIADHTRILYGGSVKPDNASSLCSCANIDGALVGGASLDPQSMAAIIQAANPPRQNIVTKSA
jgi:triosephosphate isomerase